MRSDLLKRADRSRALRLLFVCRPSGSFYNDNRTRTLGVATHRDHRYTAIGRVLVLEPKRETAVQFFAEFINARVKFAIESTGVPQLTAPQISSYRVAVPPYPEQLAIAQALSDVDVLLGGLDRIIAKKRDLKEAVMQQLLTGQTRLPGFHGKWEVKRLGELFEITSSKRVFQSQWRSEGIPFLSRTRACGVGRNRPGG